MQVGRALGRRLKAGDVVALFGDLGTGKTTLTQGIAVSLGVKEAKRVNSPSFVIVKEYKGRLPLYHIDVYRLDKPTRIDLLNLDEYIYGDGVCVIEWADKIEGLLPMRRIEVRLRHKGPTKREIVLRETGTHPNWDVSLSYDNPGF